MASCLNVSSDWLLVFRRSSALVLTLPSLRRSGQALGRAYSAATSCGPHCCLCDVTTNLNHGLPAQPTHQDQWAMDLGSLKSQFPPGRNPRGMRMKYRTFSLSRFRCVRIVYQDGVSLSSPQQDSRGCGHARARSVCRIRQPSHRSCPPTKGLNSHQALRRSSTSSKYLHQIQPPR